MLKAKDLFKLLEKAESEEVVPDDFTFPTEPAEIFPFDLEAAKVSLHRKMVSCGMDNIQIEDMEADEDGNIVVTFSDQKDAEIDVVFNYSKEEGAVAIVVADDNDLDDEENIVVDLDMQGVPLIETPFGPYINLLNVDWLSKSILETIFISGCLLNPATEVQPRFFKKDAMGNIIIAATEDYDFAIETIELDATLNEKAIDEVVYKVVVRGGKKVRRPLVRRMRKKRLTPKQRAGLRKAARTRKSPKSKMKRRKSALLRKRLHLKPVKARKGFRVGS